MSSDLSVRVPFGYVCSVVLSFMNERAMEGSDGLAITDAEI